MNLADARKAWRWWLCRRDWRACGTCPTCRTGARLSRPADQNGDRPGSAIRAVGSEIKERSEKRHQKIDGAIDRYAGAQQRQTSATMILERSALDLRVPNRSPSGSSASGRDTAHSEPAL